MTPDDLLTQVKSYFTPLMWHDGGNLGVRVGGWVSATTYTVGDVVVVPGGYLVAKEDHESGDEMPPYSDSETWGRHTPNHVVLLRKALGVFQQRSGVTRSILLDGTDAPFPDHILSVLSVSDARGRYQDFITTNDPDLIVVKPVRGTPPYKVTYFLNLRDWPMTVKLPPETVGYVADYLTALFELKDNQRARRVALASGQPGDQFAGDEELKSRIFAIEESMEEALGIIPGVSVVY